MGFHVQQGGAAGEDEISFCSLMPVIRVTMSLSDLLRSADASADRPNTSELGGLEKMLFGCAPSECLAESSRPLRFWNMLESRWAPLVLRIKACLGGAGLSRLAYA